MTLMERGARGVLRDNTVPYYDIVAVCDTRTLAAGKAVPEPSVASSRALLGVGRLLSLIPARNSATNIVNILLLIFRN